MAYVFDSNEACLVQGIKNWRMTNDRGSGKDLVAGL